MLASPLTLTKISYPKCNGYPQIKKYKRRHHVEIMLPCSCDDAGSQSTEKTTMSVQWTDTQQY